MFDIPKQQLQELLTRGNEVYVKRRQFTFLTYDRQTQLINYFIHEALSFLYI